MRSIISKMSSSILDDCQKPNLHSEPIVPVGILVFKGDIIGAH